MTDWTSHRDGLETRIRSLRAALGLVLLWSDDQRICDVAYDAITADGVAAAHMLALRGAAEALVQEQQDREDRQGGGHVT